MKDMDKAVQRILTAIENKEKILEEIRRVGSVISGRLGYVKAMRVRV